MVHDSPYPGLNAKQFRRLQADHEYQAAVATHGRVTRSEVQLTRTSGQVRTTWVSRVHRSLDQGVLRPLKALWPNGITVEWHESHSYSGNYGAMKLALRQPSRAKTTFDGVEILYQRGDTLVRRVEVDLDRVKLPLPLRLVPGVKNAIASEVERGLCRADECTARWLREHPGRYVSSPKPAPPAAEVLDAPPESH